MGEGGEELELNWLFRATGVEAVCPKELRKRLHSAVERGEADMESSDGDGAGAGWQRKVRRRRGERLVSPMDGADDVLLASLLGL